MGNKLTQVSFLFVFATLLVVIGHADITLDYKDLWIHKWVYSFHMPLFFLVSGFLFAYTHPENKMKGMRFFPFIWKKVKRQPPMPPQQSQPAYGGQYDAHWQEQSCHQEDMYPNFGQDEPAYRPEDYDEYPDFPQSMLEPRTSHYAQTV